MVENLYGEIIAGILFLILVAALNYLRKVMGDWGYQGDIGFDSLQRAEDFLGQQAILAEPISPELAEKIEDMKKITALMKDVWADPKGSNEQIKQLYNEFNQLIADAQKMLEKG